MFKLIYPLAMLMMLAGCSTMTPPVPEGYSGPTAVIKDSIKYYDSKQTNFFSVEAVDGKDIPNSRLSTRIANHGRGFVMDPVVLQRKVKPQPTTFKIVARTEYAAPILAFTNTVYQVVGKVSFTPEAGKIYVVKGELSELSSAVWVEDEVAGQIVGEKTEIKGSTALGIFEK